MVDSSGLDVAAATLALATTDARDPAPALGRLAESVNLLLGTAAGAAMITDGAVHGVVSAGPIGQRSSVPAGFGQGPGGDCARSGRPVLCADLARERLRWLAFAAKAAAAGVTGAWALPIRSGSGATVGALLLLGGRDTVPDLRAADLLAGATGGAIGHAAELDSVEEERGQLRDALRSRIPIEQAKGVLAAGTGLGVDEAFELLRGYARRRGQSLTEVAEAIVDRRIGPAAFTAEQ
ncbi:MULTISPECIES: GAF and ANTAR domain-containing protein [Pseudonocardia]|uniref:ANTAR domain protein n=2 Tax=Pseudonocardia TaxID=1847 RepID=A0A1Y2MLS7_PSEAH|nr:MULTISPECIES: GAF and ANTAR domain-containing protein [Pseudonocardia]OSY36233.1 ANTAR domain protein [Pseudonocardia autotrophica]TDN73041.1 response regulator receiver and ANTAR domain protein [Pseudonocardia autotrophica]BBG03759.1 hypothetical protein Pdca_49680 [Pseudonocardia autotrophica]GEC26633.1 hypothetical protein PSA01_36620 [Pseudonocardia saturnea]